ncbi:MAG: DUF2207 domain-containing protein [Acidimicrobiales bacterium]|nr:DUF2207 domain-containing protein [Acidimicrobiales bacterium]
MWILLGALAIVGVVAIGAFAGDTERIGGYWLQASLTDGEPTQVVEVIDYDFGPNSRRGILRQIPDLPTSADYTVSSPTAPDDVSIQNWWLGTELRIGDPDTTIRGRHRYTITYSHPGLVFSDEFAWNAIGDGWDVSAHDIEIHVTSDRELLDAACDTGELGDTGGCTIELLAPGHAVVHHRESSPGRFLTVRGRLGAPVEPGQVTIPVGPAVDPGTGVWTPALYAVIAAIIGAIPISFLWRRAGREWAWDGGTVAAAFGPAGDDPGTARRVDHTELREMTTIEFESPREYSAAVGGVIHAERVKDDHKMAWLLESAIRGEIELVTEGSDPSIRRVSAGATPEVEHVLRSMFGGSTSVDLSSYDKDFASAWDDLGSQLESWRSTSGHWDRTGARRRMFAIGIGVFVALLGTLLATVAAIAANRSGSGPLAVVAIFGLVAGAGFASVIRAWELRIRTPQGSGAWIRIESFRRLLHESEAEHVERAAEMGLLRQYSAWAVALDETDRWENSVREATAVPSSHAAGVGHHAMWIYAAPAIRSAVRAASTAPSSSGSGDGFSGGAGGGGGGGGSW